MKAVRQGPWFLSRNSLSVRRWESKFVPQEATLSFTAMWAWLPQLPTEFHDKEILEDVGRKLEKLLKTDMCTSTTLRCRYMRICIQIPVETPIEISITIGDHKQAVVYEWKNILCTGCERIGHTLKLCTHRQKSPTPTQDQPECFSSKIKADEGEEWKTVVFPRRRKQGHPPPQGQTTTPQEKKEKKNSSLTWGIQVRMFDTNSDKFLETKTFWYNSKTNPVQANSECPYQHKSWAKEKYSSLKGPAQPGTAHAGTVQHKHKEESRPNRWRLNSQ